MQGRLVQGWDPIEEATSTSGTGKAVSRRHSGDHGLDRMPWRCEDGDRHFHHHIVVDRHVDLHVVADVVQLGEEQADRTCMRTHVVG